MDQSERRNLVITVAYDGTNYLGWQATNEGPSIEESLKDAIEQILQHEVNLQAASRTDAGVHADGQVVNFVTTKAITKEKLFAGLNGLLKADIRVLKINEAPLEFHPTLGCRAKEYHYYIDYGPVQPPCNRFYSWHFPYSLNLDEMRHAASQMIGKHDFAAFVNVKKNEFYVDTIREVESIEVRQIAENQLCISIKGKNFLYKMVRNIAGTLAYAGAGKIQSGDIASILAGRDRTRAGITAPACGLFLHEIRY